MKTPTIVSDALITVNLPGRTNVFHARKTGNAAPHIRQFMGTRNLGFTANEDKRNNLNVSLLLKRFMSFSEQMDADFHIKPLNGISQSITNPRNIPTTKEGVNLYYQHCIFCDGVRGKTNVAMSKTMGDMNDIATHL
jgi:hypothetical protein